MDLTQQQAAASSGLSATTWQKLESRHEAPNDRSIRRMAKVLRWRPDFAESILAGEDPTSFDEPDPTSPRGAAVQSDAIDWGKAAVEVDGLEVTSDEKRILADILRNIRQAKNA